MTTITDVMRLAERYADDGMIAWELSISLKKQLRAAIEQYAAERVAEALREFEQNRCAS